MFNCIGFSKWRGISLPTHPSTPSDDAAIRLTIWSGGYEAIAMKACLTPTRHGEKRKRGREDEISLQFCDRIGCAPRTSPLSILWQSLLFAVTPIPVLHAHGSSHSSQSTR